MVSERDMWGYKVKVGDCGSIDIYRLCFCFVVLVV